MLVGPWKCLWSIDYLLKPLHDNEGLFTVIETIDNIGNLHELINTKIVASFFEKNHEVKMQKFKGKLGVTAQFWLKYINMIETLYQLQFAVYTNNLL